MTHNPARSLGTILRQAINAPGFHRPALRSLALRLPDRPGHRADGRPRLVRLHDGPAAFLRYVTHPEALAALELTLGLSLAAALLSATLGTIAAFALTASASRAVRSSMPSSTCRSSCRPPSAA